MQNMMEGVLIDLLRKQYDFTKVVFQMQDYHAFYFLSDSEEIKVVIDSQNDFLKENELPVEVREIGASDWEPAGELVICQIFKKE